MGSLMVYMLLETIPDCLRDSTLHIIEVFIEKLRSKVVKRGGSVQSRRISIALYTNLVMSA